MSSQIVIFGAEGVTSQEVVETCFRLDLQIAAAVVTAEPEWDMLGLNNIVHENAVSEALTGFPVVFPIWSPDRRRKAVETASALGFTDFMTIVDPTAVVATSARLGKGIYIHTGANIGAGVSVGDFALINRGAMIGHHCTLGAYVTTGGGIAIASRCRIGDNAVLGAGCTLIPNRAVGDNAVVGAGAVVIRDVDADSTVVGNPARVIERKKKKS